MPLTILLLTGIKEELQGLLDRHPFEFEKELRIYRSRKYREFYARTTGPGVTKRAEIQKVLEDLAPDVVICAGIAGILDEKDEIETGDLLRIGEVLRQSNRVSYPGGPGRDKLVTVKRPVHDILDKLDLATEFKARACDMESAIILDMVGSLPALAQKTFVVMVKVAGDRPEDSSLYEYEHLTWGWDKKSWIQKARTALKFPAGPAACLRLINHKKTALRSLYKNMELIAYRLAEEQTVPSGMKSVFIPHR
ncbi:MAG: hypothetical protein KDK37_11755 [Leptospiraceae bacterium]|nr:hypothetical protein [Leptospiraceae bacterium]MCB1304950.1 hypothetical protein [Leptospiraceae bacterium]